MKEIIGLLCLAPSSIVILFFVVVLFTFIQSVSDHNQFSHHGNLSCCGMFAIGFESLINLGVRN